jgi:signal transduction histidine kinase
MAVMAAAIALIVVLVVRRITRPLQRLADAADRLGRGEQLEAIPEDGPEEVRRSTRAFNRMSERLARFVQDRTRMLASISHDLRTPITTLRLRAEFVDDEETKEKLLQTLDEMQRITEATLTLAQDEEAQEETRKVDLAALVASLCQDLSDLGHDVDFAEAERLPYLCRPTSLKRAIRNLIENAVAYGTRARIRLERNAEEIVIIIEDDGPGIPEADVERVFEPFVRLEESRSRETGGVGLGMAIARSIVRGHGGDITLDNRAGGGLSTVIQLPSA